jgi:hypothetical protein
MLVGVRIVSFRLEHHLPIDAHRKFLSASGNVGKSSAYSNFSIVYLFVFETPGSQVFFMHFLYENAIKLKKECYPEILYKLFIFPINKFAALPNLVRLSLKYRHCVNQQFPISICYPEFYLNAGPDWFPNLDLHKIS